MNVRPVLQLKVSRSITGERHDISSRCESYCILFSNESLDSSFEFCTFHTSTTCVRQFTAAVSGVSGREMRDVEPSPWKQDSSAIDRSCRFLGLCCVCFCREREVKLHNLRVVSGIVVSLPFSAIFGSTVVSYSSVVCAPFALFRLSLHRVTYARFSFCAFYISRDCCKVNLAMGAGLVEAKCEP